MSAWRVFGAQRNEVFWVFFEGLHVWITDLYFVVYEVKLFVLNLNGGDFYEESLQGWTVKKWQTDTGDLSETLTEILT